MARIVLLQLATALIAAALAVVFGNASVAFSALLGGFCCALPNAFFALRLFMSARKPGGANPMSFFIGEFFKITLTITLLAAVVYWYRDVNWPAFLIAFIVVLKSYFILLFRH
ncbi:ATP synthase subunit I [Undibacterium oligocarboniphilum]|uniref:ATP synthase subunit I n=1 Tax=Undibacterium oligocarboniphilum TaxID=666702 RepID=A0A850QFN4_9BURK|nr:ATP synthase subunit I [Undibacterium oligocarboniphilum]MBC3869378.1 ATP synthase subunit I [Undibacterium oligocarboniphilum]NVO77757.1 ATP synthase subunit I [Undibacterium oligocarboniphilum]